MEVKALNVFIPAKNSVYRERSSWEEGEFPVSTSRDQAPINYEEVIMDLEEVKNFLYMMIRAGGLQVASKKDLGATVNKLA